MKPIGGMNLDVSPLNQPKDTTRYAENIIISEKTGLIENVPGERQLPVGIPGSNTIVGTVLGKTYIYYFCDDGATGGVIYRLNNEVPAETIETILTDTTDILELHAEHLLNKKIQLVFQSDFEGHDVFAWAGEFKPKVIDIGKLVEDNGLGFNLSTAGYYKKDFYLMPEAELFNPEVEVIDNGGVMKSGSFTAFYRYVFEDLSTTSFSGPSPSVFIAKDDYSKNEGFQGDEGNVLTNKSVKVTIQTVSTLKVGARVQIGFIGIRKGVTYAGMLRPVPITGPAPFEIIVTGDDVFVDLGDDVSELITPKALYKNIGTLTSLSSKLYAGNLTKNKDINIQEVANQCTVGWEAIRISSKGTSHVGRGQALNEGTFGYGEVYALYISALYTDGRQGRAFHIPGRKYIAGDDSPVTPVPGGASYPKFKVFDTCNNNDGPGGATSNGTVCMAGDTGYWQNDGEDYPLASEFDSARDQAPAPASYWPNVRHHKMPNLKFLLKNDPSDPDEAKDLRMTASYELNIKVSGVDFSSLSAEDQDQIIGYNIHYARRKIGEFVNISEDIPTPAGAFIEDLTNDNQHYPIPSHVCYSGDVPAVTATLSEWNVVPSKKMLRLHNLFLLNSFPSISPSFLVTEVQAIRKTGNPQLSGFSDGFQDPFDSAATDDLVMDGAYKYGHINANPLTMNQSDIPSESTSFAAVDDFAYVKSGVQYAFEGSDEMSLNNKSGEDSLVIVNNSLNGFNANTGLPIVLDPSGGDTVGTPTTNRLLQYGNNSWVARTTLRGVPGNVSSPFPDQELIIGITAVGKPSSVTMVKGSGDTFRGDYHFGTTGIVGITTDLSDIAEPPTEVAVMINTTDEAAMFGGEGSKFAFTGHCSSHLNHNAQYVDQGIPQSLLVHLGGSIGASRIFVSSGNDGQQFISYRDGWYFSQQNIRESFSILYSSDFHQQSGFFIQGINDGYYVDDDETETGIAFSLQEEPDIAKREWRNWLLLNKFIQPSEKGAIINLKGSGNQRLYIHHEHSLYITKDRVAMNTDSTSVVIGSGDIFSVTPFEIASVDEGHTGIANRNWAALTPFGYTWVQTDHGKVFAHNGEKLKEISSEGMRIHFRDNAVNAVKTNDEDCLIISDDLRRRIIVKAPGGVLSFSTLNGTWTSFQTVANFTDAIIARDKRIYIGGDIKELAGGAYDNGDGTGSTKKIVVEVVFNDGTSNPRYLTNVKWSSNFYSSDVDLDNVTFDQLFLYSDTKIFGPTNHSTNNLVPYTGFPMGSQNCRRLQGNWFVNDFRDLWDSVSAIQGSDNSINPLMSSADFSKPWYNKNRMVDKYVIVRLVYRTASAHKIQLESVEFGERQSIR